MLIFSRIVFFIGLTFFIGCGIFALVKVIVDRKGNKRNYK